MTANNASKTYDGQAYSGGNGVSYSGFVNGEGVSVLGGSVSYGGTAQGAVNAGSYTLTASGLSSSNYTIAYVDGSLAVAKATLTLAGSKTYDGTGGFAASAFGSGGTLAGVNGETLTLTGSGSVASADVSAGTQALSLGSLILTNGTGLASNYQIASAGNTGTVTPAALTVTANNASKTYDGQAYSGGNGVSYSGFVNGEGVSVLSGSVSYGGTAQGAVNAGSYALTASGLTSSNYTIAYVGGSLTVGKADLTVTANNASKTYDGQAYSGGNGVSYSGFVNGEGVSVLGGSVSYGGTAQGAVNAGSYTLTASGLSSSNYTIAYVGGSLAVAKATLTLAGSKTYDGTGGFAASAFGSGGTLAGVNGETLTLTGSGSVASADVSAGTQALSLGSLILTNGTGLASNYQILATGNTGTVTPAALTVTANNASKTYDGQAYSGGNGVSYSGFVNGEGVSVLGGSVSYGGTAQGAVNAGSYTLTASGLSSSNYTIAYVGGSLAVAKATLTLAGSKTYDGTGGFTAADFGTGGTLSTGVNGETLTLTGSGSVASANVAAGPQALSLGSLILTNGTGLASNYQILATGNTGTVTPAALTVTANNASKTYDGQAYSGGNGVSYSGFVNGEGVSVLGGSVSYGGTAQGAVNAGSYTLTASGLSSSNYTIAYVDGSLAVAKATLTLAGSKTYDGTGGFTAADFGTGGTLSTGVNGETLTLTGSGSVASANVAAGPQALSLGSLILTNGTGLASNYQIASAGNTGTITPAALTVTANDAAKTYDGQAYSGGNGVSYAGFVNGEGASVLSGSVSYGGTAQGAVNAGSYTLTASGLTSSNYTIAYVGGSLTVNKADLTVTADAQTKYAGDADPLLTYQITSGGLFGTDTLSGALTRAPGEVAGDFAILQGTLAASSNYALTYIGADLSILAAPAATAGNTGADYFTSRYEASSGNGRPATVNINYQNGGNGGAPVIGVVGGRTASAGTGTAVASTAARLRATATRTSPLAAAPRRCSCRSRSTTRPSTPTARCRASRRRPAWRRCWP